MKNFGLLIFLLVPIILCDKAGAQTGTIKQLVPDADIAVVELAEGHELKTGTVFLASYEGKQCRLQVKSLNSKSATVSLSRCPFKESLRIGQTVEVALYEENVQDQNPPVGSSREPRSLFDLSVFPQKHQSYISAGYSSSETSSKIEIGNSLISKNDMKVRRLDYDIRYGLSDSLALGIAGSALIESENIFNYGPASTKNGQTERLSSGGLGDPTVLLGYRVLESSTAPYFNADVAFGYMMKLQEAKSATATSSGNDGRGGDGYYVKAHLSNRKEGKALGLFVEMQRLNRRMRKDPTGETEFTGGDSTVIGFQAQVEPTSNLALLGEASLMTIQMSQSRSGATLIESASLSTTGLKLGIKYFIQQERAIGYINVLNQPSFSYPITVGANKAFHGVDSSTRIELGVSVLF